MQGAAICIATCSLYDLIRSFQRLYLMNSTVFRNSHPLCIIPVVHSRFTWVAAVGQARTMEPDEGDATSGERRSRRPSSSTLTVSRQATRKNFQSTLATWQSWLREEGGDDPRGAGRPRLSTVRSPPQETCSCQGPESEHRDDLLRVRPCVPLLLCCRRTPGHQSSEGQARD